MTATQNQHRVFPDELELKPGIAVTFTAIKTPAPFQTQKGTTRWRYSVQTETREMTLWASDELHAQIVACDSATVTVTKRFAGRSVVFDVVEENAKPSNKSAAAGAAAPAPAPAAGPAPTPAPTPLTLTKEQEWKLIAHRAVDILMNAADRAFHEYNVVVTFEGKDFQAMIATVLRDTRERGVR